MRQRHLLASVVALLLIGGAAPTSAGAAWTSPVTLQYQVSDSPRAVIDAQGNSVFVWRSGTGDGSYIAARTRAADGTLGQEKPVSPRTGVATPQEDASSQGDVVIVWRSRIVPHQVIRARELTAAGALRPIQTISPPGQDAFEPQVAVNANRKAVMAWRRYDGHFWRIQARTRSANGSLGPVKTLSPAGHNAYSPQVDIDGQGKAVIVWQRFVPTSDKCCSRIEARVLSPNDTLSAVQTLSPKPGAYQDASAPDVAVDGGGNAVFTWIMDDFPEPNLNSYAQVRTRSSTGALSGVQSLGGNARIFKPRVAVTANGTAVVTWEDQNYSAPGGVHVRTRWANGALGTVQGMPFDRWQHSTSFGIDANGSAVVAFQGQGWGYDPDDPNAYYQRLYALTRSASGTIGPEEILSTTGDYPDVAVNGSGQAVVAWVDSAAGYNTIQVSAGP